MVNANILTLLAIEGCFAGLVMLFVDGIGCDCNNMLIDFVFKIIKLL